MPITGESAAISFAKLPEALAAAHASVSIADSLARLDSNCDSVVDFSEFQRAVVAPSALERWLARLPLAQIISDAMPPEVSEMGLDDGLLRALAHLPADVVQASLHASLVGLMQVQYSIAVAFSRMRFLNHLNLLQCAP